MWKRREFLRAVLVTVTARSVSGCSDEAVNPQQTPERELLDGTAFFPQSIASGDPRPESVILWARVADAERADDDLDAEVEVSLTEDFAELVALDAAQSKLRAEAAFDHCVKVRLGGLSPATVYYYRFVYQAGEKFYVSHVGRTKTAPADDADAKLRFAYVSCQDFIGRYYNVHAALAEQNVDFFVHLGDYVYETTGDPTFQEQAGDRKVVLDDTDGAIALGSGDGTFYAAASLDNYRQLYKTYRSDAALQRVHERLPMIVIWDDHEFSDDAHGAVATYFDGAEDETNVARKKAANQAWFEYMPVDYADPAFRYDPAAEYPNDLTIYREFTFGKHLHLVLTDLRTYRADHVVPEDAFPGAVAADQADLTTVLGALPEVAKPYVDVDTYQAGLYRDALVQAASAEGYLPALISGKISVAFINGVVERLNATLPTAEQIALIDPADASLERGIAWMDVGKTSLNSSVGSRYFVDKDAFDALAAVLYEKTNGASEEVLGSEQKSWFLSTMESSTRTWKVWGNEYCLTQLAVDLRDQPVPEAFLRRYYMNVDAWDGFRNERSALLGQLAALDNVVAITGDIHAFYAATPMVNDDPTKKLREFVTSSVTSKPFREEVKKQVEHDPVLSKVPQAALLAGVIDDLFTSTTSKVNPHLAFANSRENGYAVVEVDGAELIVTFYQIEADAALVDQSADGLVADSFHTKSFKAIAGDPELYGEIDGSWKRWDADSMQWV